MPVQVVADRIDCSESDGKNAFGCVSVTRQVIDQIGLRRTREEWRNRSRGVGVEQES